MYILDTLIFMIAVAFTIFVFLVLYAGTEIYKAYRAVEKCLAVNSRKDKERGFKEGGHK